MKWLYKFYGNNGDIKVYVIMEEKFMWFYIEIKNYSKELFYFVEKIICWLLNEINKDWLGLKL